jgi:hypothetical protein
MTFEIFRSHQLARRLNPPHTETAGPGERPGRFIVRARQRAQPGLERAGGVALTPSRSAAFARQFRRSASFRSRRSRRRFSRSRFVIVTRGAPFKPPRAGAAGLPSASMSRGSITAARQRAPHRNPAPNSPGRRTPRGEVPAPKVRIADPRS